MKKSLALAVILTLVLSLLAGCAAQTDKKPSSGTDSAQQASNGKKPVVALVPQQVGIPYFEISNEWAQKAGKDLGVDVIYTGPTTGDAASQVNIIQDLINKKVDVIAVSPLDPTAVGPVLKKAKEAGIHVVTWDSDMSDKTIREAFVNCYDWTELGGILMDRLAQEMGEEGEYAIITSVLTAANCSIQSEAATKHQTEKYPKMKRVAYEPCDDDQAKAHTLTQNLLTAYPNLKGILSVTTPGPPAAAQAVREAGKNGQVKVLGVAEPSIMKEYLEDNSAQKAIIWHPGKLGYLTIKVAKDILDGKFPSDGDEIENVGKIAVNGNEVRLTELIEATKKDADTYGF